MKLAKCIRHAFNMVLHSKVRSWLTILGIVIGVAAVISIMSLGAGMQNTLGNQLGNLGGDILTLSAGNSRGSSMFGMGGGPPPGEGAISFSGAGFSKASSKSDPVLTSRDVQILKSVPDILYVDKQIRGNVKAVFMGKSGSVSLTGVDPFAWPKVTTTEIASGRMFSSTDTNVVIIGGRLASDYFSQTVGIGRMISINGSAFRVVGILDDESTSIYMPIQMAYTVLTSKDKTEYDSLIIKMKDQEKLNATMSEITEKLMISRHVTEKTKDFSLTSNAQMQATRSSMMKSMNIFLLAIAAVSLIVGAIGIANTLFTSVLEKTKEIGIMKAIGARNRDILLIFLFNAALIGFVGGILGVLLGMILSGLLPVIMGDSSMLVRDSLVTTSSVVIALSVSVGVGIISGLIPAYQASKLKPVDALRFE